MINVLVFPCGSEVGLEVNEALKRDKHINLFGLSSVPGHGSFVYKQYIEGISFIGEDSFLDELNDIIIQNNIDVLIPAYDDVIVYLSDKRDQIKCRLVTSGIETCNIARSKKKTYNVLRKFDFVPTTYEIDSVSEADLPLFAKPDIGQGAQGVLSIRDRDDLELIRNQEIEYVICEMLPGREYTVDCFTDSDGAIISMSMRVRNRIRNGISVNTYSIPISNEVRTIAEAINSTINFDGVWFFQLKEDKDKKLKLLEVAPRVAGSMSLSRVRGFNYILNAVYQTMGYKVRAIPQMIDFVEEDRALSNNYKYGIKYDVAYVDLDDTLILKDRVNTELISFLYQCKNENVKIKLLSRHARKEEETLVKYNIDTGLFDEVIHVEDGEKKSAYITENSAIFIDDSFRERLDVSEICQIPVFDIDCIPALIITK